MVNESREEFKKRIIAELKQHPKFGRLVVDLSACDATALSMLTQLRMMRPEVELVVVQDIADPVNFENSLLGDLPVVSVSWDGLPRPADKVLVTGQG